MRMLVNILICAIAIQMVGYQGVSYAQDNLVVSSPNGEITAKIVNKGGELFYSVSKSKSKIIVDSKLGFKLINQPDLDKGFVIINSSQSEFNETWEQPWGEKRFIENSYHELIVNLQESSGAKRKLNLIFRIFNDGVGFRYDFPKQDNLDSLIIVAEETEFNFPTVNKAWWIPVHSENSYYESLYRHTSVSEIDTANTPITIETKDGKFLVIHEANLTDYASMTLVRKGSSNFVSELVPWSNGIKVYAKVPFVTPWRTIIIGEKPRDLITSYLMLNLNEPCRLTDISWIKPSKYIGIWWGMHLGKYTWGLGPIHGATTENVIRYIDFAAENGFTGVLVEGWNEGWDGSWYENGNVFSFTKEYPDFDMEKICKYGSLKNVKLIGHHETAGAVANYEKQMEDGFALYQKNGVNSVKTGYVNKFLNGKEWHDGQFGVRHYRKVIETAAKYHIMIDNHEPVKPTGLLRTYPNLMTQEGARGQEYDAWSTDGGNPPSHTTILPFTRMLSGPFDFTPGTFNFKNEANPKSRVQTTIAKQLAMYMIIYSPLQMASDLPENYVDVKAFDFIKAVPVDWQDTKVLNAQIGEYVTIARKDRNSDDWYIGSITNENARTLNIDLSFLDPNQEYTAEIYADGEKADWKDNPTDITISSIQVNSKSTLTLKLADSGGQAIRLHKISK